MRAGPSSCFVSIRRGMLATVALLVRHLACAPAAVLTFVLNTVASSPVFEPPDASDGRAYQFR